MADTESRHHGYRGGYHGGGGRGYNNNYNNRKRRFRDDDDSNRRPQRRKYEEPQAAKLRKQLLAIAESPMRNAPDEARDIAQLVVDTYRNEDVKKMFLHVVGLLTIEQPFKIPFIAAVVLYANDKNSQITGDVLNLLAEKAQNAVKDGNWRSFKLTLRFMACLQDVLEDEGVFPILDELFGQAVDLQTASSDDAIGLELVKIILLTIPYCLVATSAGDANDEKVAGLRQRAHDLLELKTDIVASTPHSYEALIEPYLSLNGKNTGNYGDDDGDERPFPAQSELNLLQKQLQSEETGGWQFTCIPRVYSRTSGNLKTTSAKEDEAKDEGDSKNETDMDNGAVSGEGNDGATTGTEGEKVIAKHILPTIQITSPVNPGPLSLFPMAYFSLYADQDVESVPKATDIAHSLLRDVLVDTINALHINRSATARYLIEMDCFWAPGTFVKRAVPFDRLRDMAADNSKSPKTSTWKPEDVAVDAIFSQIFLLPQPEHKLVYYHSVVTDACKIAPAAIAPSLGRAIRFLFRNTDTMDLESTYRFLDWFSHHLSQFEFRWKWTEWVDEVDRPDVYPKKSFIVATIDKEIRLSFAKRIRETLPKPYHALIPAVKEKDIPDFKFRNDDTRYASEGRELLQLLRKKASESDIQPVLDRIEAQAADEYGIEDPTSTSTDAYMTCICFIGAKSLSHVLSCIERCKDRLVGLGVSHADAIIDAVVAFWANQPGNAVSIIDKLLNYTILSPQAVVSWALSSSSHLRVAGGSGTTASGAHPLARAWLYEMVAATMNKVSGRVRQIAAARIAAAALAVEAAEDQQKQQQEAAALLDETLSQERAAMRHLFKVIQDALAPVANGSSPAAGMDVVMDTGVNGDADGSGSNELTEEEKKEIPGIIQAWAKRWARVFSRKSVVLETFVGEAAMVTRISVAEGLRVEEIRMAKEREQEESERRAREEQQRQQEVQMKDDGDDISMAQNGTDRGGKGLDAANFNGEDTNGAAPGVEEAEAEPAKKKQKDDLDGDTEMS